MNGCRCLLAIVFSPLVGVAALVLRAARAGIGSSGWVALVAALASFALQPRAPRLSERRRRVPVPRIAAVDRRRSGIRYEMGVDGISAVLVLLTTVLIGRRDARYSWEPIEARVKEYYIAMLLLMVGMLGVFVALDLFLFYVFWEIMPHPDVPGHRHLGRTAAHLRDDQVRALHPRRVAAHARRDPGSGDRARFGTATRSPSATRRSRRRLGVPGSRSRRSPSSPSSSPSRSRCRCGRSTPGSPTRTSRRRPPARSSSPASC